MHRESKFLLQSVAIAINKITLHRFWFSPATTNGWNHAPPKPTIFTLSNSHIPKTPSKPLFGTDLSSLFKLIYQIWFSLQGFIYRQSSSKETKNTVQDLDLPAKDSQKYHPIHSHDGMLNLLKS